MVVLDNFCVPDLITFRHCPKDGPQNPKTIVGFVSLYDGYYESKLNSVEANEKGRHLIAKHA